MNIKVAVDEEEKKLAYQLRYKKMCEDLHWLKPTDYPGQEENDEYDTHQSIIFIALDDDGKCIGTSRLILSGKIPLPVDLHFNIYPREILEMKYGSLQYNLEVSRFIVPHNPEYKKHEITLALCREMIKLALTIGVSHAFLSIDNRFFRLLKMLGFPIEKIGESIEYMGSMTTPGVLSLRNLLPELKNSKPSLYNYISADGDMAREKALV